MMTFEDVDKMYSRVTSLHRALEEMRRLRRCLTDRISARDKAEQEMYEARAAVTKAETVYSAMLEEVDRTYGRT